MKMKNNNNNIKNINFLLYYNFTYFFNTKLLFNLLLIILFIFRLFSLIYSLYSWDSLLYYMDDDEEFLDSIKSAKENIRENVKYKLGDKQLKDINDKCLQNCKGYDEQLQKDVSELLKKDTDKPHLWTKVKHNFYKWFSTCFW